MTLLFEVHPYRGFSAAGGSLIYVITLGVITIGFAPYQVTKRLAEITAALKGVVGK